MYKKLYYFLFNAITDALNCKSIKEKNKILMLAQMKAEKIILDSEDEI